MDNLINRLNNRVCIYGKTEIENDIGEISYTYNPIKTLWVEITPLRGIEKNSQGDTIYSEITHKFIIRSNSIDNLSNDMYFIFKNQRYDIKYYMPNYKHKNYIEILCSQEIDS